MNKSGEKQQHYFRILIIGRANAGKTTLLKHISGADSSEEPVYQNVHNDSSINPTDERGIHDINQSFCFPSNPRFIFHNSPGFEAGDKTQLDQVQNFIYKRSEEWKMDKQLHAIWFCVLTNASRPFLELETKFFNEERPGKVPVIAIFTKFDDLITQVYNPDLGPQENRRIANQVLDTKFRKPILNFKFPPVACLTTEAMHINSPLCQNQIKILTEETANSLDGSILKLFVSIQRTNLELCVKNSIMHFFHLRNRHAFVPILAWFPHTMELHDVDLLSSYGTLGTKTKTITLPNNSRPLGGWVEFKKSFEQEFGSDSENLDLVGCMALTICAENSFWRCALGVPYVQALEQSFQEYKIGESRRVIEAAIQDAALFNQLPIDKTDKENVIKLIRVARDNLLPRPVDLNNRHGEQ